MQLTGCKGLIRLYWTQLNSLTLNIFLSVGVTTTVFQHSSRQLVLPSYFRSHSRVFASPCTPGVVAWYSETPDRDTEQSRASLGDT